MLLNGSWVNGIRPQGIKEVEVPAGNGLHRLEQDRTGPAAPQRKQRRRSRQPDDVGDRRAALEPTGRVAYIENQLMVYHEHSWQPAVYHRELRAEKIAEAPPEMYAHLPARGKDVLDVTSYWPDHHDWGFENRDDRPDVLFQFLPPAKSRSTSRNKVMTNRGRIIIAEDGSPVIDFPIPFCLSSQTEPGRLEAMSRKNGNKITKRDYLARMPPDVLDKQGKRKFLITPCAIGMRRLRFRDQAGLLAAEQRQGSLARKRAIIQCIPPATVAQMLVTNSLRCLGKDLSLAEQTWVDSTNRGKCPEKAGKHRVTEEHRKHMHARKDALLEQYEPPNPTAWPYDEDMKNDERAIAVARKYLGTASRGNSSPPISCVGVERTAKSSVPGMSAKRSRDEYEGSTIDVPEDLTSALYPKRQRLEHHECHDMQPHGTPGGSAPSNGRMAQPSRTPGQKVIGKRGREQEGSTIEDSEDLQEMSRPKRQKLRKPSMSLGSRQYGGSASADRRPSVDIFCQDDIETFLPKSTQLSNIDTFRKDDLRTLTANSDRHFTREVLQPPSWRIQSDRTSEARATMHPFDPETEYSMVSRTEERNGNMHRWYKSMEVPKRGRSVHTPAWNQSPDVLRSPANSPGHHQIQGLPPPQKRSLENAGDPSNIHPVKQPNILRESQASSLPQANPGVVEYPMEAASDMEESDLLEAEFARYLAEVDCNFADQDWGARAKRHLRGIEISFPLKHQLLKDKETSFSYNYMSSNGENEILEVLPLSLSSLILPTASANFSRTLSSLSRSTLSITNRLYSIDHDSLFVQRIAKHYKLPVIANERCGSWYIPPKLKAGSAYFKSTDGHTGQWGFSTRRLNLQILDIVAKQGGCIIVDSTRRGKSMPDALSKTIPIWCAVMNRFLFQEKNVDVEFYTPDSVVSASEHSQIESQLPGFVNEAKLLNLPLACLRHRLSKPLRPFWVTPDQPFPLLSNNESYHPIICTTSSHRVYGTENSENGYIQGAGDDSEGWSRGLTPSIFWACKVRLMVTSEEELPALIETLSQEQRMNVAVGDGRATLIQPTRSIYVSSLASINPKEWDAIIVCNSTNPFAPSSSPPPSFSRSSDTTSTSHSTSPDTKQEKPRILHLPTPTGKLGSRALRNLLRLVSPFLSSLLQPQPLSTPSPPHNKIPKILFTCPTGRDLAVGAALVGLCHFFDNEGWLKESEDGNVEGEDIRGIDKLFIRKRLAWITTSKPDANPSRETLQAVNAFLMRK
ncbi:MAG: hypothetical protein Q9218_007585 [Villophora microphyllina]